MLKSVMAHEDLSTLVATQLERSIRTLTAVSEDEDLHRALVLAGRAIADSMNQGGKLLVAGNGGSAADAQHIVAEFVARLNRNRAALPAIALSTDTSILTAIGNDFLFDNIFERQVEALGRAGDVFLAISTSGNAKNLLVALRLCRERGITTVGFLGNKGGAALDLCDHKVVIPSRITMHIQESHIALEHILCLVVERFYFGEDFDNLPEYLAE